MFSTHQTSPELLYKTPKNTYLALRNFSNLAQVSLDEKRQKCVKIIAKVYTINKPFYMNTRSQGSVEVESSLVRSSARESLKNGSFRFYATWFSLYLLIIAT